MPQPHTEGWNFSWKPKNKANSPQALLLLRANQV
jgi:hypothetical protein